MGQKNTKRLCGDDEMTIVLWVAATREKKVKYFTKFEKIYIKMGGIIG